MMILAIFAAITLCFLKKQVLFKKYLLAEEKKSPSPPAPAALAKHSISPCYSIFLRNRYTGNPHAPCLTALRLPKITLVWRIRENIRSSSQPESCKNRLFRGSTRQFGGFTARAIQTVSLPHPLFDSIRPCSV